MKIQGQVIVSKPTSKPTAHVGIHRIARNDHRVSTTAFFTVERAVFESGGSRLSFRMKHPWFVALWASWPLNIGKIG
jgi:hypothetical protein